MASRLGVGLISLGWMGRAHTRAYKSVAERYPELGVFPELVVAADVVERNRKEAIDVLGYGRAVTDYRDVFADKGVDIVSICAPNYLHKEMAEAASAAGKPFWIEKPMGVTLAESDAIVEAATAARLVTAVGFSYRHAPAVSRLRELVETGRLGRISNVRVSMFADYSADKEAPLTWRFERNKAGSGVLGDLLSHGFDLASHILGPIATVAASTSTFIPDRPLVLGDSTGHNAKGATERGRVENEDHSAVLARFDSGVVGVFEASRVATGPRSEYCIEVYGDRGSARWDFARLNELKIASREQEWYGYTTVVTGPGDGDFARFHPGHGVPMGFDDLKTIEASLFLRSVVEKTQYGPGVAEGRAAAALVDAAERAAESNEWVTPR